MASMKKKRLGEILCEKGFLSAHQLEDGLKEQKHCSNHRLIGQILVSLGYVTFEQLCKALLIQAECQA